MTTPLANLLALGHPSLEAVLLALAGELGASEAEVTDLHAGIAGLADRLDDDARDPVVQLDMLSERVGDAFEAVSDGARRGDFDDLRPDTVLRDRAGDELTIAALVAAAGQRRGWAVEVVAGARRAVVAHTALDADLVLSPRYHGRIVEAVDLGDDELAWCSTHEVAAALIDRVDERAARVGQAVMLERVRELALSLPLARRELAARRVAPHRARSAWN